MKPISILFVVLLLVSGIAQAVDEELLADEEPMQLGHQAYVSGDFKQAAKIWTPLAERGLAQAQFYLSNLYAQGEGVEDDPVAALSWLSRSANGHYPAAQFNLGNRYYQGLWVKRDYAKALEWWGKAAEQGVPKAAFNMAALHYLGLGTKKNVAEAMHWYRRAAEAGSLEAKVVLAKLEEGGQPPVAEPQLAKVPAKPAKPSNQPVVVGTPEESAAWIKAQAPDHYTVQLYAANTVSAVERFIQGLDAGDRLAVFGFPRDGKPYFAVIQGSYPSSEAAKAKAMEMTGQSTWVRNFAGIRAIMAE
jgi:TPR repeat protein